MQQGYAGPVVLAWVRTGLPTSYNFVITVKNLKCGFESSKKIRKGGGGIPYNAFVMY